MQDNKAVQCNTKDTCFLCGSLGRTMFEDLRDVLFGVPGKWNIQKCSNDDCGLLWVDPMPECDEIPKLYKQYYTHKANNSLPSCLLNLYEHIREGVLASSYGYKESLNSRFWLALGKVLSCIPFLRERFGATVMWLEASQRGRLLDVGCGNGKLLKRLHKLGWDVSGIEPDKGAVESIRASCSLDVQACSLEEAKFPDASFDVVIMHHVIEHLPDPLRTLMECRRILAVDGQLILITPNSISSGSRRYGPNWRGLEAPRHLCIFNPKCLKSIVTEAGFTLSETRTLTRNAPIIWAKSDFIRHMQLNRRLGKGIIERNVRKVFRLVKCLFYFVWANILVSSHSLWIS